MGHPSKQQLENDFGTAKDVDVVSAILEKGDLQSAGESTPTNAIACSLARSFTDPFSLALSPLLYSPTAAKEGYSTTNDSKNASNVVSGGAYRGSGHGGR